MSSYFAQLLATSGVQIGEAGGEAPTAPIGAPVTAPPTSAPSADIVEVGTEVPSETTTSQPVSGMPAPPPAIAPATTAAATAPIPATPASNDPRTTPPAVARETALEPVTILEKHDTVFLTSRAAAVPSSDERATPTGSTASAAVPPANPMRPGQETPPTREEILSAVMQWIAAGQGSSGEHRGEPAGNPPPPAGFAVPVAPAAPLEVASVRVSEPTPPSRKIEMETAVVDSSNAPDFPPARPATPARATPPVAQPPPATPPSVTIGSIHLRIEAPPPPAPSTQTSTRVASAAASAAASRSSGLLKLRRHYVLPH